MATDRSFLSFSWRIFGPRRCAAFALLGFLDRLACGAGMAAGVFATLLARPPVLGASAQVPSSADDR